MKGTIASCEALTVPERDLVTLVSPLQFLNKALLQMAHYMLFCLVFAAPNICLVSISVPRID